MIARQHRQIKGFTVGLFALALFVAVFVWISSDTRRPVPGLDGHRLFRLRARVLALINAIELAIEFASGSATVKQWFGEGCWLAALGAGAVAFAIAFGAAQRMAAPVPSGAPLRRRLRSASAVSRRIFGGDPARPKADRRWKRQRIGTCKRRLPMTMRTAKALCQC